MSNMILLFLHSYYWYSFTYKYEILFIYHEKPYDVKVLSSTCKQNPEASYTVQSQGMQFLMGQIS